MWGLGLRGFKASVTDCVPRGRSKDTEVNPIYFLPKMTCQLTKQTCLTGS